MKLEIFVNLNSVVFLCEPQRRQAQLRRALRTHEHEILASISLCSAASGPCAGSANRAVGF